MKDTLLSSPFFVPERRCRLPVMIDRAPIDRALARLKEIESQLADPTVSADRRKYREIVREHAALKKLETRASHYLSLRDEVTGHRELIDSEDDDRELKDLAREEIETLEDELGVAEHALMLALIPPDPNQARNAIVEIRAGTGGDEAALFAGDLYRMYTRFAESRGWKTSIIDASASDIGGYKEIVFAVEGEDVYGALEYESGVHRVQRVPITESSGRTHTSAATVAVFPEAEAEDDLSIPPDDVRVDIFRSSGPGGQSVNTTDSAVRLTHVPTGLVVQCQDEKSQHRNKEKAMKVLKARILDLKQREEAERMGQTRRSMIGSGDRSERIRTYNFPQNRLTDHRVNLTLYSLDRVMEGDIVELVEALRARDVAARLAKEPSR